MQVLKYLLVCLSFSLFSCGGGGGGGGTSTSVPNTGIRIYHGAIDLEPVSLRFTEDQSEFQRVRFMGDLPYFSLSSGDNAFSLVRFSSLSFPVSSHAVSIEDRSKLALTVCGNTTWLGIQTNLINDAIPDDIGNDQVAVRVINCVAGTSQITASYGGQAITAGTPFNSSSGYKLLSVSEDTSLIIGSLFSSFVNLEPGKAQTVFVGGETGFFIKADVYLDS